MDPYTLPAFSRVIVSVDPATTANKESDETGIVVEGLMYDGKALVIADHSAKMSPQEWSSKAVELYWQYGADCLVAEKNQGGDMVRHTIHTYDENVNVKLVHASRGKALRAEPISALYEQGKVYHIRGLTALEEQMVGWEPLSNMKSPDRIDALVHGLTELMLGGRLRPDLSLGYETEKGLLARVNQGV